MKQILIRQADGSWLEPRPVGYALESELQEILAAHPELIPGVTAKAAACREFQSGVGPADIVVVEANGDLTLVECKLAANPQIRREIVGQMFDYASRLWKLDVDGFDARWHAVTGESLLMDTGEEGMRDALARNLHHGRFRIVLAVDAINDRLKRMIEYLNAMSGPETTIIAVEYIRLVQNGIEIIMPHTYGQELAEAKAADEMVQRTVWDVESYGAWLEQNEPEAIPNFTIFTGEIAALGLVFNGSRSNHPAGGATVRDSKERHLGTVSLFHYSVLGTALEFNFIRLSQMVGSASPAPGVRNDFLDELDDIPGFEKLAGNLRATAFGSRKPNVPLASLEADSVRRAIQALGILSR